MGLSGVNDHSPKKSLGQNFFNNKNLAEKIVSIVEENNPEVIFEIGPGTGVFTHLLSKSSPLIAIEKDDALFKMLKSFTAKRDVKLVNSDIKDLNKSDILNLLEKKEPAFYGSLPYNQSKQIISQLLSMDLSRDHYYIIQKEVAEKYADKAKMNRLNAFSGVFADSKIRLMIKPHNFTPQPKVDSALIHFAAHKPLIEEGLIQKYLKFVNVLFANPRKKINKKLSNISPESEEVERLLSKRSENLNRNELITLFRSWLDDTSQSQ